MTREMNEELLLTILFLGFRRFERPLLVVNVKSILPCPNAGVASSSEPVVPFVSSDDSCVLLFSLLPSCPLESPESGLAS